MTTKSYDWIAHRTLIGELAEIGDVVVELTREIPRCMMVTRPQPGLPRDLKVLRSIHRDHGDQFTLGATVIQHGTIRVGQSVHPIPGAPNASGCRE